SFLGARIRCVTFPGRGDRRPEQSTNQQPRHDRAELMHIDLPVRIRQQTPAGMFFPHPSSLFPLPSFLFPHPSSLFPPPSPLVPHPSSLFPLPSSLVPHPSSLELSRPVVRLYDRFQLIQKGRGVGAVHSAVIESLREHPHRTDGDAVPLRSLDHH